MMGAGHHATPAVRIGFDDAEAQPPAAAPKADRVRLESARRVLPEVEDAAIRSRPWFRHPAFIVSTVTTVLAIVAMVVLLVLDPWGDDGPQAQVTGLAVTADDGSVTLNWAGASDGAELYAFEPGDESLADLSQLVRGTTAWLPLSAELYTQRTCFLVRPLTDDQLPDPLDPAAVAQQGAQVVCVADAG